jgi:DNA-binding response OmpR family regulator
MSRRILIVDDEQDMVDLLRYNLSQRGYEVLSAASGLEAVHKARREHPDLVLLDLMLDGMDGFAVCEILRQHPSTANLPVIMLTALAGEMTRLNGLDSGADDFITKPFSPDKLMARVERVFESRRQQRREREKRRPWTAPR